jgi:hypothetical protein
MTWDSSLFPDPVGLQEDIASRGRRMVTIIDPHVKRDQSYYVFSEAEKAGHFVKTKSGSDFDGYAVLRRRPSSLPDRWEQPENFRGNVAKICQPWRPQALLYALACAAPASLIACPPYLEPSPTLPASAAAALRLLPRSPPLPTPAGQVSAKL